MEINIEVNGEIKKIDKEKFIVFLARNTFVNSVYETLLQNIENVIYVKIYDDNAIRAIFKKKDYFEEKRKSIYFLDVDDETINSFINM